MEVLCEEKKEIVRNHMAYAGRLATQFQSKRLNVDLDKEEYKSAAYEGLCEAAKNFDPSRSDKFSTFAYLRIRGSMYQSMQKNVGISRRYFENLMQCDSVQKKKDKLKLPYHFVNEPQELQKMDVVLEDYGINLHVIGDGNSTDLSYSKKLNPEQEASKSEISSLLKGILEQLPERQKRLIEYHYFSDLSYSEIGQLMDGVSKSALSRIHSNAIKNLKKLIEKQGISFDLEQYFTGVS